MADKILIMEDDPAIQSVLRELLADAGYDVRTADNGMEGVALYNQDRYDLVLLDIMMPRLDGYGVCELIRAQDSTPIIILTALDDEQAQVKAFELKADDYITKPFSLKLVLLRVEAVLRRSQKAPMAAGESGVLTYGGIRLEQNSMQVFLHGEALSLTRIEFELLQAFLSHPGRVLTRDNLLNLVWGYDFFGGEKTVNVHIMKLRRKLNMDCIETIRGVGYRLAKEN